MEFVDRTMSCLDCSQPFTFTAGEQEFYSRKGFKEEPKRCKPCRDIRKNGRGPQDGMTSNRAVPRTASNSNGNGNSESILGRGNDGEAEFERGNARGSLAEPDDDIGNRMPGVPRAPAVPPRAPSSGPRGPREVREVRPSRPQRGNRQGANAGPPQGGGGGGHGPGPSSGGGGREPREPRGGDAREPREPRGGDARELFDAVCAQCGVTARVPFKPVAGRPVYCRDCYGNRG